MKNIFVSILLSFLFLSCEEIGPTIPTLGPPETGDRKVLIEEFTGVQCVNCPQGSAEIENLLGLYGDQLIAVSIHSGFFADPFNESEYDFRIEKGEQIEGFLGEPVGYPSAVINRKQVPNRTTLQAAQALWAGLIADAATQAALVNLQLDLDFNSDDRALSIAISAIPIESINDLSLTVMITENNIQDFQLTPDGEQSDYKHKHVLRDVLTKFDGSPIGNLQKGILFEKTFDYSLPIEWQVENCEVIVFLSRNGTDKEVLQVEADKIVN